MKLFTELIYKGKHALHLLKASQTEDVCDSQDAVFLEPVFTWGSATFTIYCFPPRVLRWLYT
jgi:hypothetical protein